ncbi:unnamed protein product [Closterium sp. Naga37s-1]|nr:unnamed protein product [Closterium sp. Naga37s-1]
MHWPLTSSPSAALPRSSSSHPQLSYVVVEGLMWLGVRDFINSFRKKLKLPPIPLRNHPKMRIPFGYIWSPTLAPKPHATCHPPLLSEPQPPDWGNLIDVVGFCFLNLADHYSPPAYIQQFLDSGPAPVFIGFGSLPVSDPKGLTQKLVEALQRTGQRGILQEGWGELGKMEAPNPNVLVIGNCPHDWLFPRCRAVLHHGGAGTTAAGLKAGPCRAVLHHGGAGTTAAGLKAGVSGARRGCVACLSCYKCGWCACQRAAMQGCAAPWGGGHHCCWAQGRGEWCMHGCSGGARQGRVSAVWGKAGASGARQGRVGQGRGEWGKAGASGARQGRVGQGRGEWGKAGCPTTIIPFFGDQPFWGASVHAAGVGPEPIPIGALTLDRIVAAIEFMIRAEVVAAARELAGLIAREDRVDGAVQAFHKHLPPGFQSQQHCTPWLEASPSGHGDYWGECAWWLWSFWGDAEEEEAEEGSSLPQKVAPSDQLDSGLALGCTQSNPFVRAFGRLKPLFTPSAPSSLFLQVEGLAELALGQQVGDTLW